MITRKKQINQNILSDLKKEFKTRSNNNNKKYKVEVI